MLVRLVSLVLAVAAPASVGTFDALLYVCGMDGRVRAACCCGSDDEPALRRASTCCTVVAVRGEDDARPERPDAAVLAAPMLETATFAAPRDDVRPLARELPPRATGPPLFERHCTYVI